MSSVNPSVGNPCGIPEQQANPGDSCTPPLIPDLPEMRGGCEVPKDIRVSHDGQTPTLKTNQREVAAIPEVSAGGCSCQPDSVQHYLSPQQFRQLQLQLQQQQERMCFQRYRDETKSFTDYLLSETKRLEACLEKSREELLEQSGENVGLMVGPHLYFSAISNSSIG